MINSKKARKYIDGFAQTREYSPPPATGTECAFCKFFDPKTSRCKVRFLLEYTGSWRTCELFVEEDRDKSDCVSFKEKDVVRAVEIAEEEARERAITAFYSTCSDNKDGECHAFIVGYETPDDRLHEKCEDVIDEWCNAKTRIKKFLEEYDNLNTDQP